MTGIIWFFVVLVGALVLAYQRVSLLTATLAYGGALLIYAFTTAAPISTLLLVAVLAGLVLLNIDAFRIRFISRPFLRTYRRMLPSMSQTEKDALEAGTVWWDGELFTGGPDWDKLLSATPPRLTRCDGRPSAATASSRRGRGAHWPSSASLSASPR